MISQATERFWKAYHALPEHVQERARAAYQLFSAEPAHPSLRFRQVHPTRPIFSARVGLGYRALAVRDGEVCIWFWIGTHADYDQLIRHL